jgi:hypothetical protein
MCNSRAYFPDTLLLRQQPFRALRAAIIDFRLAERCCSAAARFGGAGARDFPVHLDVLVAEAEFLQQLVRRPLEACEGHIADVLQILASGGR